MLKFELHPACIDNNIGEMAECAAVVTTHSVQYNGSVSFYMCDNVSNPKMCTF